MAYNPYQTNQSVSGTVGASIIGQLPAGTATIGSVTALQGTNPYVMTGSVQGTMSVLGTVPVTQATASNPWIITGSVQGSFSPAANQSVSGAVTAPAGSVMAVSATQGTTPWIIGSIYGNISGSVAATVTNTVTVVSSIAGGIFPISGSVAATVTNFPTTQNVSGSVVAFQGAAPWTTAPNNSSLFSLQPAGSILAVSGSFSAGNTSVMLLNGANVIGSVTALQGTSPWNIAGSVAAALTTSTNASVITMQLAGSIMATSATVTMSNSSVMLLNSPNVIGSVAALQGTNPWIVVGSVYGNVSGSVVAFQGAGWAGSVLAVPTGNQSVSGTVINSAGADIYSSTASILVGVTANTNGSVFTTTGYQQTLMQITSGPGASITGAINFEGTLDGTQFVPIQGYNISTNVISSMATVEGNWAFNTAGLQGMRARVSNWTVGSITARVVASPEDARPFAVVAQGNQSVSGTVNLGIGATMIGSVVAYQGATPWVTVGSVYQGTGWSGSVAAQLTASTNTSVITIQQAQSIVGTYSVAGTHAAGDKGVYVLGARNDAMASILGADGTFVNPTYGPVGETIVANAPITKWVNGNASILGGVPLTGGSVAVIAAQGASIFTYITGLHIINAGATTQWLKLEGATSSTIGYAIAPAGGGTNMNFPNGLKTNANGAFTASISGSGTGASVYITAQGFISKT